MGSDWMVDGCRFESTLGDQGQGDPDHRFMKRVAVLKPSIIPKLLPMVGVESHQSFGGASEDGFYPGPEPGVEGGDFGEVPFPDRLAIGFVQVEKGPPLLWGVIPGQEFLPAETRQGVVGKVAAQSRVGIESSAPR